MYETYLESWPVPVEAIEAVTDWNVILCEGRLLEPFHPRLLLHPLLKLGRLVDLCKPLVVGEGVKRQSAVLGRPRCSNQQESSGEFPEIHLVFICDCRDRGSEQILVSASMQKTKLLVIREYFVIAAHVSPAFSMILSSVAP